MNTALTQLIKTKIATTGPIPFAEFMRLALYAPGLGYYSAGLQKFGKQGDFITAPEISPLFSQCIAKQCQQVLTLIGDGDIVEFGAGSGSMAAEILQSLQKNHTLPKHYYIIELSAELKQRQHKQLKTTLPDLINRVVWLDQLPQQDFRGIILANEVLDAMPVHKFKYERGLKEYYVDWQQGNFVWQLQPADAQLTTAVHHLNIQFNHAYNSEINLMLKPWISSLANVLSQGIILLIDYGYPRHEYYHPQRSMGTLRCHHQHQASDDPLVNVGEQDITAHVDFTAIAEAAVASELQISGYTNQANFLLSCGLTDLALQQPCDKQFNTAQQMKQLTLPSEMGEIFKVIGLNKRFDDPLLGFRLNNKQHTL